MSKPISYHLDRINTIQQQLKPIAMILDTFDIVQNEDRKQWEFTPNIEGYTSYTVSFSECDNKEDACISVWKNINKKYPK